MATVQISARVDPALKKAVEDLGERTAHIADDVISSAVSKSLKQDQENASRTS